MTTVNLMHNTTDGFTRASELDLVCVPAYQHHEATTHDEALSIVFKYNSIAMRSGVRQHVIIKCPADVADKIIKPILSASR